MNPPADRLSSAFGLFDAANCADPNLEQYDGVQQPRELVYAWRMTEWLARLAPQASEPLRLAARCQHICRWIIARNSYAAGRRGYVQWRTALADFHAERAGTLLSQVGYEAQIITRVQDLVRKKGLTSDPEAQLLEDVVCLVFLESYFADFLKKHEEEKIVSIIRKTWQKMSPRARQEAQALKLSNHARRLLDLALAQ